MIWDDPQMISQLYTGIIGNNQVTVFFRQAVQDQFGIILDISKILLAGTISHTTAVALTIQQVSLQCKARIFLPRLVKGRSGSF